MEGQHIDQIAQAQPLGTTRQGGDDQVGRGQHAIIRMVMFGEPGLVKTQPLAELDLFEEFRERVTLRDPGPCLVVTETAKAHRLSLPKCRRFNVENC